MRTSRQERRVCDLLDFFVPDLVSTEKYRDFLPRLFTHEHGQWLSVRSLCEGMEGVGSLFEELASHTAHELVVVWLDHPLGDPDYAFIQFYHEEFFWKTSAIVHRKLTRLEN